MIVGIFCYLEKVLDCVSHNILLSKLKLYGITGKTHFLKQSYLEDRFQKAEAAFNIFHNTTTSDGGKISHGIPQRSILGPLIVLIYVNYLRQILSNISILVLLADGKS